MHHPSIIERAFQLARECGTVDDIRRALRKEGYESVDAHLSGGAIKGELKHVIASQSA